jgi:voltage-gated potassium channel Kch
MVYFSLVTMTSVGYGDIAPLAAPARSLAALEGLLSQLYLAIIIARLVGLEIAGRMQNSGPDND